MEKSASAIYLGVKNYGLPGTDRAHIDDFLYRFQVDGAVRELKIEKNSAGNGDAYPLQNRLKRGYACRITWEEDRLLDVENAAADGSFSYASPVTGVPGERTLWNFIRTALMPAGTTLYIYGGGWNWQDTGSAMQTRTRGVASEWVHFFRSQDEMYTFKERDGDPAKADPAASFYPYGGFNEYYYAGLDCSGYLGWVLYNTFETVDGRDGYVCGSTGFAENLALRGWGTRRREIGDGLRPGDVVSIRGHVWISLGTCADGSVVMVHSTPSVSYAGQPGGGVQVGAVGTDKNCMAYRMADRYMAERHPLWYARYPVQLNAPEKYLGFEGENTGIFSWSEDVLDGGRDFSFLQAEAYSGVSC